MTQIAMKFVQWDVPELEKLKDSKVYKLRERLDNGDKLSREEKNWLTRNVKECCHFKRGIALMATTSKAALSLLDISIRNSAQS